MRNIVLTLGHNSSAIVIEDGKILAGYEEERLTGIKSDSAYPINAIQRLQRMYGKKFDVVFVSHWFADTVIRKCKYADVEHMKTLSDGNIKSLSQEFSHHDAHDRSAQVFAKSMNWSHEKYYSIVVDGFGSFGETLSVYKCNGKTSVCMHRAFGYDKSLGLLFQYATAFLGMKMQSDEYKLLGYEAHAAELSDEVVAYIYEKAHGIASKYVDDIFDHKLVNMDRDPIVSLDALGIARNGIFNMLEEFCHDLDLDDVTDRNTRIAVSLLVQTILETTVIAVVSKYNPKHLVCSGGVFMNVKLNRKLLKTIPGDVCVMPLAGDQGAGLGVYDYYRRDLQWPGHLYWGKRELNYDSLAEVPGIEVYDDQGDFENAVITELRDSGRVNIITGDMEFGARALCNTTTLGMPFKHVTEEINQLNDRTTIMPMAPVMTYPMSNEFLSLKDLTHSHLSEEYMIMAMDVEPRLADIMPGASHYYPGFNDIDTTCRPQVMYNIKHPVYNVLEILGHPLINTSFNYHGMPIVFDTHDIIKSHNKQNHNGVIKTFVLRDEQ